MMNVSTETLQQALQQLVKPGTFGVVVHCREEDRDSGSEILGKLAALLLEIKVAAQLRETVGDGVVTVMNEPVDLRKLFPRGSDIPDQPVVFVTTDASFPREQWLYNRLVHLVLPENA